MNTYMYNFEDEILDRLIANIIDTIEEDDEEIEFQLIYLKDELPKEQYFRLCKIAKFILENIFPFDNFTEKIEDDSYVLRVSDDEGIFHTCFFEISFFETDVYTIIPKTCGCLEIIERLNTLLPALLAFDYVKLWLSISLSSLMVEEYKERVNSLIKMYVSNNNIESWTHISFLAETISRKIYSEMYPEENEDKIKNELWNRLLKRLQSEKNLPILQHVVFLIDSIRPLRNEVLHQGYVPSLRDVEFGITCIIRIIELYTSKSIYENSPKI